MSDEKVPTTRDLQRKHHCSRRQAVLVHKHMKSGDDLGTAMSKAKKPTADEAAPAAN